MVCMVRGTGRNDASKANASFASRKAAMSDTFGKVAETAIIRKYEEIASGVVFE